jgi:PIN domain nuclease of toxin-antitoxin system
VSEIVLDASAVLALMQSEPGADAVAAVLPGALLGMVNLAEVVTKLCERGMPVDLAHKAVASLGVRIAEFTEEQARLVGELRPLTRSAGLSLGDRACLALGRARSAVVLTAEGIWPQVADAVGVEVKVIR